MINVYFNYPNPHVTIHQTSDCPLIQKHHALNQRIIKINVESFHEIISKFVDGDFNFNTEAGYRDAWFEIDFGELAFEIAIVNYLIFHLGRRYAPFDSITPDVHC